VRSFCGPRGRLALCATALAFALAGPALSADPASGVGRIENTNTGGGCTAALIAPDLVVTAAHCGGRGDTPSGIVFRPGDGRPGTYPVARVVRHPLYDRESPRVEWRLRFDLAVAVLETPVPGDRAIPFPTGDDARVGETLHFYSWREGPRPRQRPCPTIDGIPGLVTLGCLVKGGESGSPVLRATDGGLEIVAVISSRGRILDQPVAQASDVRLRLPPILDILGRDRP